MAAHQLPRFSKSILDKPQLMHIDKYAEIMEVLENRSEYLSLRKEAARAFTDGEVENSHSTRLEGLVPDSVGVLDIDGPLTAKANLFQPLCGGTSYEALIQQTKSYAEQGKSTLLLMVSSGGGEAFKLFSSANQIKKIAKDAGMKIIAYIDGISASAAYGLSVIADEIISHPESSTIGSVGVIMSMVDSSKKMEKEGIRQVIVSAGKGKHPYAEDMSFKPEFIDNLQKEIDKLYTKFVTHVASNRNLSEQTVRDTEANTYNADDSLDLGLIDKVMTEPELFTYLENIDEQGISTQKDNYKGDMVMSKTPQLSTEEVAALQAQLASMQELEAKLAVFEAKALAAKTAEMKTLVEGAELSNVEGIVNLMMGSEDVKTLMSGVIEDIGKIKASHESAIASLATSHSDKIAELTASHTEALEAAKAEATEAKAKAEDAKTEFAASKAIEGDNTSLEDTAKETKKSSALANFIKENY